MFRERIRPGSQALLGAATAATLVLGGGGVVTTSAAAAPEPVTGAAYESPAPADRTEVTNLEVPDAVGAERSGESVVAELPARTTERYTMVALTWRADPALDDLSVEVRTRSGGTWSDWTESEIEPTGESPDEASAVAGSELAWVGDSDGVAARAISPSGQRPQDLEVVLIDPSQAPLAATDVADDDVESAGDPIAASPGFPGRPAMISRKSWGADPKLGDKCFDPKYGETIKSSIVHHTVNSNGYSRKEAASIVRGIQVYHTQSRAWCDIGYNFLIDRFGRIYEGRRGGVYKPVRGSHAGEVNTDTVGVSMIGDYDKKRVPKRTKNAMVRLVGWKMGTNYTPVRGRLKLAGIRFGRIAGHRDVMSTACPGKYAYKWLPKLRRNVIDYVTNFDSAIRAKRKKLGGASRTGATFVGEMKISGGRRTRFGNGYIYYSKSTKAHWVPFGKVLDRYRKAGGYAKKLGFPRRDYKESRSEGTYILYTANGQVLMNPADETFVLNGKIASTYTINGGPGGRLGLPLSSMKKKKKGWRVDFENGYITLIDGKVNVVDS